MNTLILVMVMMAQTPYTTNIDAMTTEQQKEWLLAYLTVDLRFDEDKIAVWEEKLNNMTPTRVAVVVKAYMLSQEKKRQQEEKAQALRLAKEQLKSQQWHQYYNYRYHYHDNYTYPIYRPAYRPNYGYPVSYGYPAYPFRLGPTPHR